MKYSLRYDKFWDDQSTLVRSVLKEFTKPLHQNKFFLNKTYLLSDSASVDFNKDRWVLRPDLFSFDVYDTPYLYPVVFIVNKIRTMYEFHPDNIPVILYPRRSTIYEVLQM